VIDRVLMVVDAARVERAHRAVVDHDVRGGHQEGHPVLVEGEHDDRHEEQEVRLGLPVPGVDEQRARGDQAERDQHRGYAASALDQQRDRADRHERGRVREAVVPGVALGEAEHDQPDRLEEEQADHRVVPVAPGGVRQGTALG
jgi:hypothetical protein